MAGEKNSAQDFSKNSFEYIKVRMEAKRFSQKNGSKPATSESMGKRKREFYHRNPCAY